MLKTLVAVVVLVAGSVMLSAQTIEYLNSNNVLAGVGIGGSLFSMPDSPYIAGKFEVPKGSSVSAIYKQAIWVTGYDAQDTLHCAAQEGWQNSTDYYDGPITYTFENGYHRYYGRVFKVTRTHVDSFRSLSFPIADSLVDTSILYWPGKGNPSVISVFNINIQSRLAPFIDVNGNGIYEPLLGDYPAFCGDEGIFFVFNDGGPHTASLGEPLGIEIRGMANCFNDSLPGTLYSKNVINNTIFVQFEIENKSYNNYTGVKLGSFVDPDVGCFQNDRAGCDTARNLMFAYNGQTSDPNCAPENGYGDLPVAVGAKLLNQSMNVFGEFQDDGNGSPDPVTPTQFEQFQNGFWGDSVPFRLYGYGYHPDASEPVTRYLFPGDPNDSAQWSEVYPHDRYPVQASDRRMYASMAPINFNQGDVMHLDMAYFASFDGTSDYIKIVDTLKRDADIVQSFYDNEIVPCRNQFTSGIHGVETAIPLTLSIYPNPTNNNVTIESTDNIQTIQLMDIEGRVLLHKTIGATKTVLPVNTLAKGVYLLNVQGVNTSVIRKIVVE